jgi:hypothetical protein
LFTFAELAGSTVSACFRVFLTGFFAADSFVGGFETLLDALVAFDV